MSKKIVIIGTAHPLRGGLATYNESLARQFQREGHDVDIYTFSLQYPSFLFPGTSQYSEEPAPKDLNINVLINSINPLNWLKVGRLIKQLKPEIVVVRFWIPFMGPCLGTILRIIRTNKTSKVICIADNVIPHETRFGDKLFTAYFVKAVDAFITMSKKVKEDLMAISSKSVMQVIHPLYDHFGDKISAQEAKLKLSIPADQQIVLFFGFIRKYKGLDLLLEAISILNKKGFFQKNQVKFLIAGEFYESAQPYLDAIQEFQIEDYIILHTHFIADSEVKYYLSAADCVIQPYKNATQSGVTPLAYHFEKPMIVTNVGGLPEMVPAHVGLIAEPNALSISTQIEKLFTLDLQKFSASIQEEKKKYSWSIITQAILSLSEDKHSL